MMNEEYDDTWDDIAFTINNDGDIEYYFANGYFFDKLIDSIVDDMSHDEKLETFYRILQLRNPDVFDKENIHVTIY